jgi:hypothetical protein
VQAPILGGANPEAAAREADTLHVWEHLVPNNMLYQDYVPLLSQSRHHSIELPPETWQHIVANARQRDPVTDRDAQAAPMQASLDVFSTPTRHADRLQASVGTIMRVADGTDPEDVEHAVSNTGDLLYGTMHAHVHGRRESIEHLLFPSFFPAQNGFYRRILGMRFSPSEYLKHRCRQAFSPFTKHAPYLLLLRSINTPMQRS